MLILFLLGDFVNVFGTDRTPATVEKTIIETKMKMINFLIIIFASSLL